MSHRRRGRAIALLVSQVEMSDRPLKDRYDTLPLIRRICIIHCAERTNYVLIITLAEPHGEARAKEPQTEYTNMYSSYHFHDIYTMYRKGDGRCHNNFALIRIVRK